MILRSVIVIAVLLAGILVCSATLRITRVRASCMNRSSGKRYSQTHELPRSETSLATFYGMVDRSAVHGMSSRKDQ
jgi:hypothetical protein